MSSAWYIRRSDCVVFVPVLVSVCVCEYVLLCATVWNLLFMKVRESLCGLIFKLGASLCLRLCSLSGNSKGVLSKILLLCVEVCNGLYYEFMHDMWLWGFDCVVGDTTVNVSHFKVCTQVSAQFTVTVNVAGSLCD